MPEQQSPATRGERRGARALRETVGRKEERKLRALLGLVDGEAALALGDVAGETRVQLGLVDGEPVLGLADAAGETRALLGLVEDEPALSLLSHLRYVGGHGVVGLGGRAESSLPQGFAVTTRVTRGGGRANRGTKRGPAAVARKYLVTKPNPRRRQVHELSSPAAAFSLRRIRKSRG